MQVPEKKFGIWNFVTEHGPGKDTPFTFHAHWIGQRLLVSEDFLEDHTHTHALSERVSAVCSIAFPCKITTVYFQNIVVPTGQYIV